LSVSASTERPCVFWELKRTGYFMLSSSISVSPHRMSEQQIEVLILDIGRQRSPIRLANAP
ncbi:hypothetical protein PMAYCL1PPCAC_09155, partial [Pristionchus mayeri]